MTTPHIQANVGDFAETVLMPGDPLRAKYIAENFLDNPVCINQVRNMLAYTGTYKGKKVSVMGSGMGIPSISIYASELFKFYEVKNIIRVGSCGGIQASTKLRDIVIGIGASTDSLVNRTRLGGYDFAAVASYELLEKAVNGARTENITANIGQLFSTDLFYNPDEKLTALLEKYHVLGIEMEAAGLYGLAAEFGQQALSICTVSDHIVTGASLDPASRETSFNDMVKIALYCI